MANNKNSKNIIIGVSIIVLIFVGFIIYYCFYMQKNVDNDASVDNLATNATSNVLEKDNDIVEQNHKLIFSSIGAENIMYNSLLNAKHSNNGFVVKDNNPNTSTPLKKYKNFYENKKLIRIDQLDDKDVTVKKVRFEYNQDNISQISVFNRNLKLEKKYQLIHSDDKLVQICAFDAKNTPKETYEIKYDENQKLESVVRNDRIMPRKYKFFYDDNTVLCGKIESSKDNQLIHSCELSYKENQELDKIKIIDNKGNEIYLEATQI